MNIVSTSRALREGTTANSLIDIANWHAEKAAHAKAEGDGRAERRHREAEDILCARARLLRIAEDVAAAA